MKLSASLLSKATLSSYPCSQLFVAHPVAITHLVDTEQKIASIPYLALFGKSTEAHLELLWSGNLFSFFFLQV